MADAVDGPPGVVDRLQGEMAELRRSRERLVAAADADRHEIESALHSGVQQDLAALALNLRRAAGLVDGDPAAAKALLDELAMMVRQSLDETAELARSIYPPLLEARGLASALRAAAAGAGVTASVKVNAGPCPPQTMAAVYWCCVEALLAAPDGSHGTVSVLDEDGAVALEVAVTGAFDEGRLERLRDRVGAHEGSLTIHDLQDGSSRISASLPSSR
ncbi:MAG: histidine kinase [Chloroflexota bacterium]